MIRITDKHNCCGCGACSCVCPVQAITMRRDSEGFAYPRVDAGKCVRCYQCLTVCAFKKDSAAREEQRHDAVD